MASVIMMVRMPSVRIDSAPIATATSTLATSANAIASQGAQPRLTCTTDEPPRVATT
jgi:hypothetical protein